MTPESGREIFKMKCGSCHSIDGSPGVGPTLKGVIGREIGALPGFSYSRGLAAEDGKWTTSKFAAFARNPATAGYPDSSMPPVPALGPRVMDLLVDYINEGKP